MRNKQIKFVDHWRYKTSKLKWKKADSRIKIWNRCEKSKLQVSKKVSSFFERRSIAVTNLNKTRNIFDTSSNKFYPKNFSISFICEVMRGFLRKSDGSSAEGELKKYTPELNLFFGRLKIWINHKIASKIQIT